MKNYISIILLIISITNYSQSKIETEDWIKEKINSYSFKSHEVSYSYDIRFDDGIMSIRDKSIYVIASQKDELNCDYWIPIKEISSFRFEEKGTVIHLKIFLKNNKKIKYKCGNEKFEYEDNFYFFLDNSLKNNDMINRMTKALNNLIKLHGGSINKEPF
jgi:hypothetical protein